MHVKNKLPVNAGETQVIEITGLGHSGEGVGRLNGFTVFVPYALPGEKVQAKITTVKKTYAKARLDKVIESAAHRVNPRCRIFEQCGGCQFQHMDYSAQLAAKRQTVVDAVTRIGKIDGVEICATIGADNPWFYRNKMQFPVGADSKGLVIGCYAQGTHNIINTDNCLIQHEVNNEIVKAAREILASLNIQPYDENTGKGVVRHVLGRVGTATGEVMVVLVTATDQLPHRDLVISNFQAKIPGLVSIIQNVNSERTNVILGKRTRTLWGKDTITDRLGDFLFNISAVSFFQVNTRQAEVLYNKAVEYAGLTGGETVIDAYCGTGTITLFLARRCRKVYGIEVVGAAIEDARINAQTNGISNTEFIVGDTTDVMPRLFAKGVRPHAVVVDPPRAGCALPVLETFVRMNPERIVYVSCNPASLARDLALLEERGYKTVKIQPVDMFPHTYHVESVVLLQKKHML
jgi:23S rRNA (uracil1939-C5)-methyltransferase